MFVVVQVNNRVWIMFGNNLIKLTRIRIRIGGLEIVPLGTCVQRDTGLVALRNGKCCIERYCVGNSFFVPLAVKNMGRVNTYNLVRRP